MDIPSIAPRSLHARSSTAGILATLLLAATACVGVDVDDDVDDDIASTAQAVHANAGSSVTPARERNDFAGRYPEVMYAVPGGGCTGTVIAPYAVLTAAHCGEQQWSVNWEGPAAYQGIAAVHLNPYLRGPYVPSWWASLNAQQKAAPGGRQDDWPAQHDHEILFVPSLTPQFLRDHGITPAAIDPYATASATDYTLVGVGSTGGGYRDSIARSFVAATAGTITRSPRDGYLSANTSAVNVGNADPGDSGGPTMASRRYTWIDGSTIDVGHVVVGTTQNPSDMAPLAYNPGITMTSNQLLTVRINALWASARADDADGDGLPSACDANPAAASTADNLCPDALGGPRGAATVNVQVGQLTCRPGYAAVGMRGRSGDLIDRLAVQCRALSCFENNGAGCANNPIYEYWTDEFGGTGGGAWDIRCPNGQLMVGVDASDNTSTGLLHSIGPRCATYGDVVAAAPAPTTVSRAGNVSLGNFARRDCSPGKVLSGFQARSSDARYVTGVQPVCSSELVGIPRYLGGQGGGDQVLRCPVDYHAIGTVQNADAGAINSFGLLRGPRALRGDQTPASQIVVARGGYWHYPMWRGVPAAA